MRDFDTIPACDRRTDSKNGFIIASTALCIASYADCCVVDIQMLTVQPVQHIPVIYTMFIVERNVQENVLDVFLPFLHPALFQLYNSC